MRIRYQTNPKVALLGLALSLGLIFGAQEFNSALAAHEARADIEAVGDVIKIEPVKAVVDASLDQRTC